MCKHEPESSWMWVQELAAQLKVRQVPARAPQGQSFGDLQVSTKYAVSWKAGTCRTAAELLRHAGFHQAGGPAGKRGYRVPQ